MKEIFLIHWNQSEAEQLAQPLRTAGWDVDIEYEDGARAAKNIKTNPPDIIVIYHTRLPSHGRSTAAYLAENKATREIPLIFVGDEDEALEKSRRALPLASFIDPEKLIATLSKLKEEGT